MNKAITIAAIFITLVSISACSSNTYNKVKSEERTILPNVNIEKTVSTIYEELDKLPEEYNLELAQKNGDIVYSKGEIYNSHKLNEFYSIYKTGKSDITNMIRIVTYTKEGDAIIHDLVINGQDLKLIVDNTRDEFGSLEYRIKTEYKVADIIKENKNNQTCYTIVVDKNKGLFSFYV